MRERELFEAEIARLVPRDRSYDEEGETSEKVVSGTTLYLPIALNKTVAKTVGAFVPVAAKTAGVIDVIVYFHGHAIAACGTETDKFRTEGMLYYWNTPRFRCLRRDLEASGRCAVLLALAMHPFVGRDKGAAGYGDLNADGKFDDFVGRALKLLEERGALQTGVTLGNVVLAGHSGGGEPMQAILDARNVLKPKIRAAWGFECLYFGTTIWKKWLRSDPRVKLRHFRRTGWKSDRIALLRAHKNFVDTQKASTHCKAVEEYWSKALATMPSTPGAKEDFELEAVPAPSGFELRSVDLYRQPIVIAKIGSKDKGTLTTITEAPADFLPHIVERAKALARAAGKADVAAKLDPSSWFGKFTRIKFLGRPFKGGQYIHVEMAKALQAIERSLVGSVTGAGGDAKKAGDILLNKSAEGLSGSRLISATATFSMHMFGLAVDVNYLGNPFIESGDIDTLNAVLRNASALLGTAFKKYAHDARYDAIAHLDGLLERYFALQDEPAQLTSLVASATAKPWAGMSTAQAQARVKRDLDTLSSKLARGSKDSRKHFKTHGIMDFDKRFVEGMERGGLSWGAAYGDIMHFDMRSSGVGKYIQSARTEYANKAKALARKHSIAKQYGAHPMVR